VRFHLDRQLLEGEAMTALGCFEKDEEKQQQQ